MRRAFEVMRMRDEGLQFREIGDRLGVSMQRAHQLYSNALTEMARTVAPGAREAALRRLDAIAVEAWEIVRAEHHVVAGRGARACAPDGRPALDPGPKLVALNTLLRVEQRRAKLLGLDAPTEHAVLTIDRLDAEIERLVAALGDKGSWILDECGYRPRRFGDGDR